MKAKNLSPQKMFATLAGNHRPRFRFGGDFQTWKKAAKPEVLATLGATPPAVAPDPELTMEWEDRGIIKRRYLLEVGPGIAAAVQVNLPSGIKAGEKRAAILCWHGHGPYGKEPVMGNLGSPGIKEEIARYNYDYGHQMAEEGYVTYGLDWIGAGERNDTGKPHFFNNSEGRDWCNLYYLHATMLGTTTLAINLAHGRAATDFVCSLPEVDAGRLGVMGLSGGGALTVWTALTDARFKAAEIICYSDLWALFGIRDNNYCGMQITPGLYALVDLPELQGLMAPLPLLVDIGAYDTCFQPDNAMTCHRQLRSIYEAAGAADRLHLDLFPGEHAWGGRKSRAFFKEYLGG